MGDPRPRNWVETTHAEIFDRAPTPAPVPEEGPGDTAPPASGEADSTDDRTLEGAPESARRVPESDSPELADGDATDDSTARTGETASEGRGALAGLSAWWVVFGFLIGGAAAAGVFVWLDRTEEPTPRARAEAPVESPDTGSESSSPRSDQEEASQGAAARPETPEPPSPDQVRTAVDAAKQRVRAAPDELGYITSLLEVDHYGPARTRALDVLTASGVGSNREAAKLYRRSVRQDPAFDRRMLTLGEDVDIGAIHSLGGGWSISFRMTYRGRTRYAFKPMQKNWTEGWRAEIASDRLCQVLPCGFDIPRNRPAKIRRDRFEKLYRKVWDEDQKEYAERFDDLVWTTEIGDDGKEHEYLYGTLKDWVPDFVRWPLEYTTVWEPWLDARQPPSVLDQPLEEALAPFKDKGTAPFYRRIVSQRGDATTRSMARQLSNILVFDFLVSNWDRFSTATQYYGVNNQFADGQFVSIDNGAAFPTIHFPDVRERLSPVSRFSRRMITAIRALNPETLNPVLFPEPSIDERARLEVFWSQRDRLLDRMRTLVSTHGRDAVYAFE